MLWKAEMVKKYENHYRPLLEENRPKGNCVECGATTSFRATNMETEQEVFLCYSCYEEKEIPSANVPFPVRVVFTKILKNELGMGNPYFPSRPSRKFFEGLSGSPSKKEWVNFRSHEVYLSLPRAEKEGYLSKIRT